jgi:20S proteasome alpha/beta subunit
MTLILAAKGSDGAVYIASDRRGSNSHHEYTDYKKDKLIRMHNYVVGYTYSYRTAQLIEFNKGEFAPIHTEADVFTFAQTLKRLMQADGQQERSTAGNDIQNTVGLIIATSQRIYEMESNYAFFEHDWIAVGSGKTFALGYYAGSAEPRPLKRLRDTIRATSGFITSVGGRPAVLKVVDKEHDAA